MLPSAHRINTFAQLTGARRYLELGVWFGHTFRDVNIAERTGVDPSFAFDENTLIDEHTHLFRKTSDDFFASNPLLPPFDIAFIDGLHTFEQVLRDFLNVLLHTHDRSVIIVDDTVPNDVYSTNPSQAEGMRHRKAAGNPDMSWHGDVFKLVFFIHDFMSSLNYRTVMGAGNPQTIVWRANNVRRVPIYNDLERISRLTYFDFADNIGIFKQVTDAEATDLCLQEINAL